MSDVRPPWPPDPADGPGPDPNGTGGPDGSGVLEEIDGADELLSAYVDGEASPAEVARVEGDPALAARAARFAAARAALSEPVAPLGADAWSSILASARAQVAGGPAATEERTAAPGEVAEVSEVAAPVVDLAAERSRRRPVSRWLAAAAAVVLLVGVVAALARRSTGGGDSGVAGPVTTASTGGSTVDPTSNPTPSTTPDDLVGAGSGTTVRTDLMADTRATASGVHLGPLADPEAARRAVASAVGAVSLPLAHPADADTRDLERVAACTAAVRSADPRSGALRWWADARYVGEPAYVLVLRDFAVGRDGEPRRWAVVRAGDCRVLAAGAL